MLAKTRGEWRESFRVLIGNVSSLARRTWRSARSVILTKPLIFSSAMTSGNFFNDFNSGAYLVGRAFPKIKVFIDRAKPKAC